MHVDLEADDSDLIAQVVQDFLVRHAPSASVFASDIRAEIGPFIAFVGLRNQEKQALIHTREHESEERCKRSLELIRQGMFLAKQVILSRDFHKLAQDDPGKP